MQAKDKVQEQLRQKVNSVNCTVYHVTRGGSAAGRTAGSAGRTAGSEGQRAG